jgi:hypothetical protein
MVERLLDALFIAYKQELEAIMAAAGYCRTFNHDTHALIPAHRIDGDTRQAHVPESPPLMGLEPDGDDFATVIVTASIAQVVRALEFTTVRAFMECIDAESVMAAAHAPT